MSRIYEAASKVIVDLGEETLGLETFGRFASQLDAELTDPITTRAALTRRMTFLRGTSCKYLAYQIYVSYAINH